MVVLATDIYIGAPAINRGLTYGAYTTINNNSANESGVINSVEIWCDNDLSNCEVATFFRPDPGGAPNNFTTRDSEAIGTVLDDAKRTFVVDLDVVAGDYIGIYYTAGYMERDNSGCDGMWAKSGDNIPCTDITFSNYTTSAISLYGTGTTFPAQVTGVLATDGTHTDKVVITWNVASGATGYDVWTGASWVDVGNVLTYDHTTAPAPTITVGTASASDGTSTNYVTLSITGESANVGSSVTYKVRAYNAAGDGAESATNAGYRGVGALTYQWQRSSGDADDDYSNIDGGTTDPYNDTGAPENGDGRYFKCIENAIGASQQITNADRGYRIAVGGIVWNGVTITKWNGVVIAKWNDLE